jgi:hypothetical protein
MLLDETLLGIVEEAEALSCFKYNDTRREAVAKAALGEVLLVDRSGSH